MNQNFICRGAEAIIFISGSDILKQRISKGYRIPKLDKKLIERRTKKEAKLLEKAKNLIPVPKIKGATKNKITMEFIQGKNLAFHLEKIKNADLICQQIGMNISKLHDSNIIHGDLTTSNMIAKNNKVYFIDFGLGFESSRNEDKAVDLHVLKEALRARHFSNSERFWTFIIKGYKSSKNSANVLKRLKTVEKRGRYKQLG